MQESSLSHSVKTSLKCKAGMVVWNLSIGSYKFGFWSVDEKSWWQSRVSPQTNVMQLSLSTGRSHLEVARIVVLLDVDFSFPKIYLSLALFEITYKEFGSDPVLRLSWAPPSVEHGTTFNITTSLVTFGSVSLWSFHLSSWKVLSTPHNFPSFHPHFETLKWGGNSTVGGYLLGISRNKATDSHLQDKMNRVA